MTADIEELARQAIARQAETITVDRPQWADVLARRPQRQPWPRLALAVALVVLIAVVAAAAIALGGHDKDEPLPPVDDSSFAPVDHRPTGDVQVLYEESTPQVEWQLIAYPSTLGPCIGVRSANPAGRPVTASGFPAASSECAIDLATDKVAAFHVAVGGPGNDGAGLRPHAKRLVVGLTADRAQRVTAKVNGGDSDPVHVYPVPFAEKLGAFVVPVTSGGDFVDVRVGKQTVTAAWSPDNVIGPGVVIAKSATSTLLVHDDGDLICVRHGRGGGCGRGGTSWNLTTSPGANDVGGTTELGATAVHLLDGDGRVVAMAPTFGCDLGYRFCFFAASGKGVTGVQAVDAAGNRKRLGGA